MSLFDPEVDRPEHDEILTTLFNDPEAIARLIAEAMCLPPLTQPSDLTMVQVQQEPPSYGQDTKVWTVTGAEACTLAGPAPRWKSLTPVRIVHKELETLLNYSANEGRSSRLIGFIDMSIRFDALQDARVLQTGPNTREWVRPKRGGAAYIEVKSAWPTAGNLLRQLNLYRASTPSGIDRPVRLVVGPDDSMNGLLCAHGWRLVTFGRGTPWAYRLVPPSPAT